MATRKPLLTARALRPVIAGLEAMGYRVEPLLAEDLEGRVPAGATRKLWEGAAALTGDDNLGMHLALAAPIASFDVHGYALLSSPTLRDAYGRGSRYQRLIHEVNELSLTGGPDDGILPDGGAVGPAARRVSWPPRGSGSGDW